VADVVREREREAEAVGTRAKPLRRRDPAATFTVRHFAGPRAHVDQLDRLRIAHLTDLHVGRVTPHAVQCAAVRLTNEAKPDLVCITGDFVCHSQAYLDQLTDVIRGFEAPVVAVLGNHDYWSGAVEVSLALRRAGPEILSNRNTIITLRHQRLQLVGLDDAYTGHARRDDAVRGLTPKMATLALSHIAEEADGLWHHGIPLVLSGHTHAGQVTLARLHEFAIGRLAGHRYVHGLYGCRGARSENGAVYVGAGVGAAVIPLRVGERGQREVTIFELGAQPGSFDEHHEEQRARTGRPPSPSQQYQRAAAVIRKEQRRRQRAQKKTFGFP
jgi:predicted MPP superfamily phosphohydrolase